MKLYHYVHCPYCIRVRMGLGFLNLPYQSIVLPYNDEATPMRLTGVKMLPILEIKGKAQNESLEILKGLDSTNRLHWEELNKNGEINQLLEAIASPVHSLCMPYWIWTPEFDSTTRQYFQSKKEVKRGPFKQLVANRQQYITALEIILEKEVESQLTPFYKSSSLSIMDIMLAAHLWGMYIVPEFQFGPKMHAYLQSVKALTHFDYHQDFWK